MNVLQFLYKKFLAKNILSLYILPDAMFSMTVTPLFMEELNKFVLITIPKFFQNSMSRKRTEDLQEIADGSVDW